MKLTPIPPIYPSVGEDGKIRESHLPTRLSEANNATKLYVDGRVPEGLDLRLDTTVGNRLFAGDAMIYGDTGWRDISHLTTGIDYLHINRYGDLVSVVGGGNRVATGGTYLTEHFPEGFSIPDSQGQGIRGLMECKSSVFPMLNKMNRNRLNYESPPYAGSLSVGDALTFQATWTTEDPWPTTLPGVPI